jgi:hypothetical protein
MDQRVKKIKTTICKVYFKPIFSFITEIWTLSKRETSKMQTVNMHFLRRTEGEKKKG